MAGPAESVRVTQDGNPREELRAGMPRKHLHIAGVPGQSPPVLMLLVLASRLRPGG